MPFTDSVLEIVEAIQKDGVSVHIIIDNLDSKFFYMSCNSYVTPLRFSRASCKDYEDLRRPVVFLVKMVSVSFWFLVTRPITLTMSSVYKAL